MSTRRALAYSFLDRYASHAIAVVSIIVLSRLLTPREIGLFSLPMIFVAVISALRDFGAGQYLVQEADLTRDRIRAAWTVQLGLGVLLALLVAAFARPTAGYFEEPEIRSLMLILALNFAVTPFGSITYAWLSRHLHFRQLTVLRLSGALTNALVAIALAWFGHGAASLAWANLAGAVATALAASFFRPADFPWWPGLRDISRVVGFGTRATAQSILGTLGREAPLFFLGKLQDVTSVGLYSRAVGFLSLFQMFVMQAVYAVTLPAFAKAEREGRPVDELFLRALTYTTALGWSFLIAAALLAHPLVRLVYGVQWLDSVPLIRVLALSALPTVSYFFYVQLLVSRGRMDVNVRLTALTTAAMALACWLGARHGALTVAWATIPVSCLIIVVWSRAVSTELGLSHRRVARALAKSALVAIGSNIPPLATVYLFGWQPVTMWAPLTFGIIGAAAGFLILLRVTGHPLGTELDHLGNTLRAARQQPT